jgi:hypothetical protein
MCENCWVEAGSPTEKTPDTDHLVKLIRMLYEVHCAGGPLHVHVDDYNLDRRIVPFYDCYSTDELDTPEKDLNGRTMRSVCDEIAAVMNEMTETQRLSAMAIVDGFVGKSA